MPHACSPAPCRGLALRLAVCLAGAASSALAAAAPVADLVIGAAQVQALALRTEVVGAAATALQRRFPGTVAVPPARQRTVSAPTPGLVERLNVGVGDEVRAGQVLAVLRSPAALELQREAMTAASQAELAGATLRRDEQLHAEGVIGLARLEQARAQAQQARWMADERRKALEAAQVSPRSGGLVSLVAPMAGSVLERLASVGQRVDGSAPLLRIAALGELWLELQVPVAQAAELRLGDAVALDGAPGRGVVTAIGRAVDAATQSVLVRATLSPAPDTLRIGQAVTALVEGRSRGGAVVSQGAVVEHAGRSWVFVEQAPGRLRPTPVEVVSRAGAQLQLKGLGTGDRVVVQGVAALKAQLAAARP